MTREMRRFKQRLSEESAREILCNATNGVLSLVDADGMPYGVPLNYVYDGGRQIYFHSAVKGYKMDCIDTNCACSFCVVGQDNIVPDEFTSYFRSVIVKGVVHRILEPEEIRKGLLLMCHKYSPGVNPDAEIEKCIRHVAVLRLDIESITGKEAIELVRDRG